MGPTQGEELPRWRIVVLVDIMLVIFANRQCPRDDFHPTGEAVRIGISDEEDGGGIGGGGGGGGRGERGPMQVTVTVVESKGGYSRCSCRYCQGGGVAG